jgi:regulator of protease activity HflC (stomatin/prohibitin superfamily)
MVHTEKTFRPLSGLIGIAIHFGIFFAALISFSHPLTEGLGIFLMLTAVVMFRGYFTINPGFSKVIIAFGSYKGSVRTAGFYWSNPLEKRLDISLKPQTNRTHLLRINDKAGYAVEAEAHLIWKIRDTAKATFEAENLAEQITMHTEAAMIELLSTSVLEEGATAGLPPIKENMNAFRVLVQQQVSLRTQGLGIEVAEIAFSHLDYAPEMLQLLLQKRQVMLRVTAQTQQLWKVVDTADQIVKQLEAKNGNAFHPDERKALLQKLVLTISGGTVSKNLE